jgi:hypothetical protein
MISVYEERRRAPLHFEGRAEGALGAASVLWNANSHAGFLREASLALELIIKAVIAQRLELGESLGSITRVPISHNVSQLWSHAKLPKPSEADYGRLVRARVVLMWAGRYPAPNKDADGDRDDAELWEHDYERPPNPTSLFRTPRSFNLEDVRRIYSIANDCFWDLRRSHAF